MLWQISMNRAQFSLSALMAIILLVAIQFGALTAGTALWASLAYTATVALLLMAAVLARYRGPFWYGFAVVGWGYFLIGVGPWFCQISNGGRPLALYAVNDALLPSLWTQKIVDAVIPLAPSGPQYLNRQSLREFRVAYTVGIAHTVLTLLLALCGGFFSRLIARRKIPSATANDASRFPNSPGAL